MPFTVALTGASGFIGRNLASQILQSGWQVRALVRSSTKASSLLPTSVQLFEGCLENITSLKAFVTNCDSVVHAAGVTKGVSRSDFYGGNVEGTANLIQACLGQSTLPHFVLLSSLAAREPDLSPYAWSKWEGEKVLRKQGDRIPWIIFRPPAVYGPYDQHVVPLFTLIKRGICLQLNDNNARFSLIHVDDVTRAIIHWLQKRQPCSQTFEIDDGRTGGYSWQEVFQIIHPGLRLRIPVSASLLSLLAVINEKLAKFLGYMPLLTRGKVAELRHGDWVCDLRATKDQLGWAPQVPLQEGLRRLKT